MTGDRYRELCALSAAHRWRVRLLTRHRGALEYLEIRDRDGELLSKVNLSGDDDLERAARISLTVLTDTNQV